MKKEKTRSICHQAKHQMVKEAIFNLESSSRNEDLRVNPDILVFRKGRSFKC
jgi:hypothetical protein